MSTKPDRLMKALNSYDLVAKSMPGIVLLLGLSTLIPSGTTIVGIQSPTQFADFAVALIVALLLGLFIGEGVHTLAESVERIGLSVTWTFMKGYEVLKTSLSLLAFLVILPLKLGYRKAIGEHDQNESQPDSEENDEDEPGESQRPLSIASSAFSDFLKLFWSVVYRVLLSADKFVSNFYWGLYPVFMNHRQLFARSLAWNYDPSMGPWEPREKGEPYDCFIRCFEDEFEVDLTKQSEEEILKYYPLITSQLTLESTFLAQRFQAIYSFCRSMWVVFGILTALYSVVVIPYYTQGKLLYEPMGLHNVPKAGYWQAIVLPLIAVAIFLIGTGRYKRHYIDYLITDYCTTHR